MIAVMKILGLIAGVAALFLLRSVLNDGFRRVMTTATTDKAAACLTLAGSTTREENGQTYIVGNIRNRCESRISHVNISFRLDPRPGSRFESPAPIVVAYSEDVQPGETRAFRTALPVPRDGTYRFEKMSAY